MAIVKRFGLTAGFLLLAIAGACSRAQSTGQTQEDILLTEAVSAIGAESANAGSSGELSKLSQGHLAYMIDQGKISHDNYESRNATIQSLGGNKSGEIVASNCGIETPEAAATKCADQWENSPGHRKLMRQTWGTASYLMKQAQSGCYYCIGLFANGL